MANDRITKNLMKKTILFLLIAGFSIALFLLVPLQRMARQYTQLVAVSWGDSTYAPALYGAYVFVEPQQNYLMARVRIYIDRPSLWQSQQLEIIDLGKVNDQQEAVAMWSKIDWSSEGVRFGNGDHSVLLSRSVLESHR
jgi:hypothetical protein